MAAGAVVPVCVMARAADSRSAVSKATGICSPRFRAAAASAAPSWPSSAVSAVAAPDRARVAVTIRSAASGMAGTSWPAGKTVCAAAASSPNRAVAGTTGARTGAGCGTKTRPSAARSARASSSCKRAIARPVAARPPTTRDAGNGLNDRPEKGPSCGAALFHAPDDQSRNSSMALAASGESCTLASFKGLPQRMPSVLPCAARAKPSSGAISSRPA